MKPESRGKPDLSGFWERFEQRLEAGDWRQDLITARELLTQLEMLPDADLERELQPSVDSLTWEQVHALRTEIDGRIPKGRPPEQASERQLARILSAVESRERAIRPPERDLEPEDITAVQECVAVNERVLSIAREVYSGRATEEHAVALKEAVCTYRAVMANAGLSRRGDLLIRRKLAGALEALAYTWKQLDEHDAAETCFENAVREFEDAGDELSAAESRQTLIDYVRARDPDADERLRTLLTDPNRSPTGTLGHAQTLVAIAELYLDTFDLYGARLALAPASEALARLGYPAPGDDIEASLEAWLDEVPRGPTTDADEFRRTISTVLVLHVQLARVRSGVAPDLAEAERWDRLMQVLGAIVLEMPQHQDVVSTRLDRRLSREGSTENRFSHQRLREAIEIDNESGAILDSLATADETTLPRLLPRARRNVRRARAHGPKQTVSASLYALGKVLDTAGRAAEAVVPMREAAGLLSAMTDQNDRFEAIVALTALAELHVKLGEFELASDAAGEAITAVERDRYRVTAPFLRGAFLAPYMGLFGTAIFAAWKLHDYDTMLARAELAKARVSVRRLLTRRDDGISPEVAAHDAELRRLGAEIQRAALRGDDAVADLRDSRQIEWDLREIASRDSEAESPAIKVEAIQAVLKEDEAVLYHYWLRPTELMLVTLTSSAIVVELHMLTAEQRALIERLVAEVRTLQGSNLGLDETFIAPLADVVLPVQGRQLLNHKHRIAISPHGPLRLFPFAAALWDGEPLVRKFALRSIPNLASLLLAQAPPREPRMLAIAVSRFPGRESTFGPLPLEEAKAIATVYAERGVPVQLRSEVTRSAISEMIEDGTLAAATSLLVSTHGESADPEAPMDAILALADSAVEAMEIVTWPLGNCEVVTLSACYGGQFAVYGRDGRELPGDEMFGIPAAFLQAGAKMVLAPVWPVDARIAAPIVIGFHRQVAAGLGPDVALRQAQCEYLDDPASWPEAYFWAGFNLVSLGMTAAEPGS